MEPLSPPGRTGPGGECRMPAVNGVGEPCAGEPHARFDGEGLETEPRPPRQSLTLHTFRGRLAKGPRGYFTGFSPAISAKAKKAKGKQIRDWHLNRRSGTDLSILAREINPQVQGWINYYGAFYRSELR